MSKYINAGIVCAAKDCPNKNYNCKLSFFCFPKHRERAEKWLTACGREDLRDKMDKPFSYRLCASHFDDKMYLNDLKNRLLPSAIPTIFPSSNFTILTDSQSVPEKPVSREENVSKSPEESYLVHTIKTSEDSPVTLTKKRNRCCVQGCNDLVSSRHRFPKREPEIFEAWLKIVKPSGYESLSKDMICNKYSVCDRHFRECDRIPKWSRMRGLSAIAVPLVNIPGLDGEYAESVVREALAKRDRRCMVRCMPVSHDADSNSTIAIEFADNYMTNYHIIDSNTNEEFLLDETTGLSNVHSAPGKMVLHIQITENQFENHLMIKELPKCGKCHQEAVGKSVIYCDRGCEKPFHISCIDISQQNFDLLKLIDGATWFCTNCRKK